MTTLHLSIGEPFTSPAWGSNMVVFSSASGEAIAQDSVKEYLSKACRYAKHYKVYVVPERFFMLDYHSMCLISPEGKVMGAQRAVHLNLSWQQGRRAEQLLPIRTEFGMIFLCVDVDIYHPEITRVAEAMGSQIVICSQHIQVGDYNTGMVINGVWGAAQNCSLFVVGVSNQYNGVCAPRRLTENDDGFVITPRVKMPVTAQIQAENLKRVPMRSSLSRRFYVAHHKDLQR